MPEKKKHCLNDGHKKYIKSYKNRSFLRPTTSKTLLFFLHSVGKLTEYKNPTLTGNFIH